MRCVEEWWQDSSFGFRPFVEIKNGGKGSSISLGALAPVLCVEEDIFNYLTHGFAAIPSVEMRWHGRVCGIFVLPIGDHAGLKSLKRVPISEHDTVSEFKCL